MRVIADFACQLGEGVLWHPVEQAVYFVDIEKGRLFRGAELLLEGDPIGGFTCQQDGLVLFMAAGHVRRWQKGKLTPLVEIAAEGHTRFNDVIATPDGRVLAGTMPADDRPGRLYRFDPDGSHKVVLDDLQQPNGMGFSPDGKWLYLTESNRQTIHRFAYRDGELTEGSALVVTEGRDGVPDGMTVDAEGYLWSARWDGSSATRYDPQGREVRRVEFPARKLTSLSFGGPDYGTLYASSAGGEEREQDGPQAGCLFATDVGVKGKAEFLSRL